LFLPYIEWNEKYSVHIEEIDSQHKKIFSIINRLHDGMKARRGKEVIGGLLDELVDYTYYHFATEERYFRLCNYPHFEVHKSEHDLMRNLVFDLRLKFDANSEMIIVEAMELLKDWLSDHVLGSDQKYAFFLHKQGIA
jgi:hemerythrin